MYPTEKATVKITFGLYSEHKKGRPHYTHYLCEKAAKKLWDECEAAVNLGFMHLKIEKYNGKEI